MKARVLVAAVGFVAMISVACKPAPAGLSDQDKAAIRQLDSAAGGSRTEISFEGAGDFAYRHVAYERTSADRGKNLQIFRRQADGAWRVIHDVSNSETSADGLLIPTSAMAADASPEVQNLARVIGRWTLKATEPAGVSPTPGTRTDVMTCAWFPGGKDVICRTESVVAGKAELQVDQYSYDPVKKSYVVISNNSGNPAATGTLSVQPGAWIRTIDWEDDKGLKFKSRVTFHNLMIGGGDWKMEFSAMDGPFATVWQGTFAKEQ